MRTFAVHRFRQATAAASRYPSARSLRSRMVYHREVRVFESLLAAHDTPISLVGSTRPSFPTTPPRGSRIGYAAAPPPISPTGLGVAPGLRSM